MGRNKVKRSITLFRFNVQNWKFLPIKTIFSINLIYPTPSPQAEFDIWSIFETSKAGLNSEIFFSETGCLTYIHGFSKGISAKVNPIFYDHNLYATFTSFHLEPKEKSILEIEPLSFFKSDFLSSEMPYYLPEKSCVWFGLVWFYGISTIVGYLMPSTVLWT